MIHYTKVQGVLVPLEKLDEAPNWFRVLIYTCAILIFGGVLVFIMYAQATGQP